MIKTYLRDNIGTLFVITSLIVGVGICFLLPAGIGLIVCFIKSFSGGLEGVLSCRFQLSLIIANYKHFIKLQTMVGILIFEVVHLILTLITYGFALREDIKNINENRFPRIYAAILIFVVVSTSLLMITFLQPIPQRINPVFILYLILSPILLSFAGITLSVFILIITLRISTNLKVWRIDTILIPIAALLLFIASALTFLMGLPTIIPWARVVLSPVISYVF